MGTWRCPHCETLQVEGPRCFLCNRSATSCGTCVNFRRSLVGGLGYCAVDREREPLTGDEQRPCWTAPAAADAEGLFGASTSGPPEAPISEPVPIKPKGRLIELQPQARGLRPSGAGAPSGARPQEAPPVSGA